jgi:hypothetical protein
MIKSDPIQKNDLAFAAQMLTCKNNLPTYAAVLGLAPAEVDAQAADAVAFDYWVRSMNILHQDAQQFTAWKDLLRDGGTPPTDGAPGVPVLPAAVPVVAPGIEARFRALVQKIKGSPNYNVAIGDALNIEGAQQTPPDLSTVQPVLTLTLNGNHVEVGWGWQGNVAYLDQCEIQVDRGDGKGYVLLTFDPSPGYTDTTPLPATPAKWTYRRIYRVDEAQVGQWSSPVSITVGG